MAGEFPIIGVSTPMNMAGVMIHDKIIAHATASSGKNAKVRACKVALGILEGLAPFEYRLRFSCNCNLTKGTEKAELGEKIGTAI